MPKRALVWLLLGQMKLDIRTSWVAEVTPQQPGCVDQRCKNIQTCKQGLCKKDSISGKIFAKFHAVLSGKWVMLGFHAF